MADVYTRIGYIKGATGAQGAQGLQGDPGEAATIEVGSVTTVPYGQTANVTNSGTESAAIFDFQIPQGRPGEQVTDMQNLTIGAITTSAASFPIPAVGETGKVLWGKVVKWFSDMSALVATKLNAANVVNNLTTTASGYALDARQGKALNDVVDTVITVSTIERHQTNTTNASVYGRRVGRMVQINGWVQIPSGKLKTNIIFVGLPTAVLNLYLTAYDENSKTPIELMIDSSIGRNYLALGEDIGSHAGHIIVFNMTYITSD